jgi:hypothetical protein
MQPADVAAASGAAVVERLLERQREWAAARELELEDGEHVRRLDDHLFRPLPARARQEWARELASTGKPGELSSLLSSAALACNLFEALRGAPGFEALRLAADLASATDPAAPRAEAWIDGTPPAAVFVRYREPYEGADNRVDATELDAGAWGPLAHCRSLAADLHVRTQRFASLPAAALLRAARALTSRTGPRGFRLVYVWHEVAGRPGREHRREVDRLRMRIGGEVDFEARTLREWIGALAARPGADPSHAAWLEERYLRDRPGV